MSQKLQRIRESNWKLLQLPDPNPNPNPNPKDKEKEVMESPPEFVQLNEKECNDLLLTYS